MTQTAILGTGSYLPQNVLTNEDLENMVDTSHDWINTRCGIRERRIATDSEPTSFMATMAAQNALQMADVAADDIHMIIVGTTTPDMPMPSAACLVQSNLGARDAVAFDISAACSGFIYALTVADKFVKEDLDRKILVIGADLISTRVDWKDRSTCVLFGDGAGAVLVTGSNDGRGVLSTHLHSDGSLWNLLYIPGGGCLHPPTQEMIDRRLQYIKMKGNEVFKCAVRSLEEVCREALLTNGLSGEEINLFVPHQANSRIIESVARRLNIPLDKIYINIHKYGNTWAASIPIALDEAYREGSIHKGDLVLLTAFGGGFTWGSALIRW